MTDQTPEPESGGSQNSDANLKAYVDANTGRFTEEAITAELARAGYATDDVRAALADAAARGLKPPPTGRAIRTILAAYVATFAILSLGMLTNLDKDTGHLMPTADAGVWILAGSLGVAFIASLLWVASRRVFALLIAVILGLSGVGSIGSDVLIGIVMLLVAIAIVVLVLRAKPAPAGRSTATFGLLLAIPVLLLLVVGGICVASGLPIPRLG